MLATTEYQQDPAAASPPSPLPGLIKNSPQAGLTTTSP